MFSISIAFLNHLSLSFSISFFEINKKVIERTKKLVEIPYLKSLDSIHLSTALGIAELIDGVVTYDKQMIKAAKELELSVVSPV